MCVGVSNVGVLINVANIYRGNWCTGGYDRYIWHLSICIPDVETMQASYHTVLRRTCMTLYDVNPELSRPESPENLMFWLNIFIVYCQILTDEILWKMFQNVIVYFYESMTLHDFRKKWKYWFRLVRTPDLQIARWPTYLSFDEASIIDAGNTK